MLAILHGALGDLIVTLPLLELLAREGPLEVWGPEGERTALLGPPRGPAAIARAFPRDALPLWGDDPLPRALEERLRAHGRIVAVATPGPLARHVTALGGVVLHPPLAAAPLVVDERASSPGGGPRPRGSPLRVHATDGLLVAYGREDVDPRPRLARQPDDAARGQALAGAARYVVVHPGSGGAAKQWPVASFAAALDGLKTPVIVVTGPAEAERGLADLALLTRGRRRVVAPPLDDLCALLASAAAVLGNDAGPSHLAAALDVPLVAVFTGPSDATRWAPRGRAPVQVLRDPTPAAVGRTVRELL